MDTCPMCTSNSALSFCDKRKLRICEICRSMPNYLCHEIKEKKYDMCNQHGKAVKRYCRNCFTLACITCLENHKGHDIISIKEAYGSIKNNENLFTNGLQTEESILKCYEKNYKVVRNMIEEEEKSWLDLASSVKVHVYNKLLDTDIRQAGAKLLQTVNEIQDQLRVLQAEECQFTFLSKWPSVISWLNEYNKVKQAVLDGQRQQHNASCISQMFRRLILNHDGSPVDTPIDNDIKLITEKMSGVSINETSGKEQNPNDGDDGFVHVESSDVDCNRPFGNNKDEHACLQKLCQKQSIEIANLKKELEQFGNKTEEHAGFEKACHEQTLEITDLKKKLENLKEEHTCLKKTCDQQKIQIDGLSKNREHSKEEHSSLVKTCDQLKAQLGDLKQNLELQRSEKEQMINFISSIEQWTSEITKHKEVCKKSSFVTSANDTPNLKACKKMMQPVMDAIVDSTNDLISQRKEITIRNGRITELVSENGKLRQQQFEHQTKEKQYYDYTQQLTITNENAQKRLVSLDGLVESWRLQCADKEKKIQILQAEKDDLQTRLSSIAGDKLAKGNPAITDLSDPNRPMKISEKYGELYDNEWTDAIECTGTIKSLYPDVERSQIEEIIIRHLYKLLTMCYKECLVMSRKQLRTIGETVCKELNLEEEENNISNIPGCGEVCKFRRQYADMFAEYLIKHKVLTSRMDVTDWEYVHKNADLINELAVTPFFEKCVHLCWYMAIQDPIMYLSEEPIPDSKYDKNMYKEFVQSGDKVKFVVWPTLFLHDGGPILYKGVVQAYS